LTPEPHHDNHELLSARIGITVSSATAQSQVNRITTGTSEVNVSQKHKWIAIGATQKGVSVEDQHTCIMDDWKLKATPVVRLAVGLPRFSNDLNNLKCTTDIHSSAGSSEAVVNVAMNTEISRPSGVVFLY